MSTDLPKTKVDEEFRLETGTWDSELREQRLQELPLREADLPQNLSTS